MAILHIWLIFLFFPLDDRLNERKENKDTLACENG